MCVTQRNAVAIQNEFFTKFFSIAFSMFISSRRAKGGRNPQVVIKFWDCRQATFLKLFRSSYCEYVDGFSTARNFSGFTPRRFRRPGSVLASCDPCYSASSSKPEAQIAWLTNRTMVNIRSSMADKLLVSPVEEATEKVRFGNFEVMNDPTGRPV